MSQAGRLKITSGSLPSDVPLQFTTDSLIAIPSSNNLNLLGSSTSDNNNNGIQTTASGASVTIQLTNRITGSGSTMDANTTNLVSFPLDVFPCTYLFQFSLVGRETTTGDSFSAVLTAAADTDGVTATNVQTVYTDIKTSASLENVSVAFGTSGNSITIDVTGVAGTSISYNTIGSYVAV